MNKDTSDMSKNAETVTETPNDKAFDLNNIDVLSQYLKTNAGMREGRAIPPLEKWNPQSVTDMDLIIKANGEWWHEGGKVTRESLVSLFASVLWKEDNNGTTEYYLKTPVQKMRIHVEDAPLLINDVGIVNENNVSWLEFTTTTGDVVRLDDEHSITLKTYDSKDNNAINGVDNDTRLENMHNIETAVRPYMMVRNNLTALISRNTFYHLTEIGELLEDGKETVLTLQSGGKSYQLSMPNN